MWWVVKKAKPQNGTVIASEASEIWALWNFESKIGIIQSFTLSDEDLGLVFF